MGHIFSWIDNRTLLLCQCLLALFLSGSLFFLRKSNRHLHGVGVMAASFPTGVLGVLLVMLRGSIPLIISTAVANTLVFLSYYLTFRGVQMLVMDRSRYYRVLEISGAVGVYVLVYYTSFHPNIVPRTLAAAWFIFLARGLSSLTLFRFAKGRRLFQLGGAVYGIFSLLSLHRFVMTWLHGSPQNFMQRDHVQSLAMIEGFAYIALSGLFILALITGESRAELERDAQHDSLTGALNRATIDRKLAQELELAGRTGLPLSLMLLDLDNFKSVNDTVGHAGGDAALRSVARCISGELRAYDAFGRYGGDEMILLLPATPGPDAILVAERIRQAVLALPPIHQDRRMTLSIGVAQSEPADSTAALLARADSALYKVKRSGRNGLHFQPYGESVSSNPSQHRSGPRALTE